MNTPSYLLSDATQLALRLAESLAYEYSHSTYGPEHLLCSLTKEDVGLHPMFNQLDKEPSELYRWALAQVEKHPKSLRIRSNPPPSEEVLSVFKETQKLCLRYGYEEITPTDLFEAICTPGVAFKPEVLRRLPVALYEIIDWRNKNLSNVLNSFKSNDVAGDKPAVTTENGTDVSSHQVLQKYCDDITAMAREGKIDPLIGRDRELKQLVEILGKRLSPNVLIVGEPGVGKTALIGGLAQNI